MSSRGHTQLNVEVILGVDDDETIHGVDDETLQSAPSPGALLVGSEPLLLLLKSNLL